jgi:hypothetical protein
MIVSLPLYSLLDGGYDSACCQQRQDGRHDVAVAHMFEEPDCQREEEQDPERADEQISNLA